jgi:hypothetical protein
MPAVSSARWLRPVTSLPLNMTLPSRNFSRPKIALNTVDLPAPFGPMTVVIDPPGTEKVVPFKIVILP